MAVNKLILPVKGTTDFYPAQMAFRKYLTEKAREVSERFGYQEYDGPCVEELDLYAAKSGEELVKEQAFTLKDKGGRTLALRPEMTPTLARMVAQNSQELPKPIRWYNIGPRWRYEKPQTGRGREFYQWDIDILGGETPETDAEIIAIAAEFLKSLGLSPQEVKIKVSDRKYLEWKLRLIEVPEKLYQPVIKAIDRLDKIPVKVFEELLEKIGLSELQRQDLTKEILDHDFFDEPEAEWLTEVFSTLEDLGVKEWVEFDPKVVRGLDYYTRTVFEAKAVKGKFRSIFGGGRYDNLVEDVGGKEPIAGVGFAVGIAGETVLPHVLEENRLIPKLEPGKTRVLVTVFETATWRNSLKLARDLRAQGVNTELYPEAKAKLDKQLKYADKKGIPYVVIVGPEEVAKGVVTVKEMKTGKQREMKVSELAKLMR
jgi:histidyl-tRNA synthetase